MLGMDGWLPTGSSCWNGLCLRWGITEGSIISWTGAKIWSAWVNPDAFGASLITAHEAMSVKQNSEVKSSEKIRNSMRDIDMAHTCAKLLSTLSKQWLYCQRGTEPQHHHTIHRWSLYLGKPAIQVIFIEKSLNGKSMHCMAKRNFTRQSVLICWAKLEWMRARIGRRTSLFTSTKSWNEYISDDSTKCWRSFSCGRYDGVPNSTTLD